MLMKRLQFHLQFNNLLVFVDQLAGIAAIVFFQLLFFFFQAVDGAGSLPFDFFDQVHEHPAAQSELVHLFLQIMDPALQEIYLGFLRQHGPITSDGFYRASSNRSFNR